MSNLSIEWGIKQWRETGDLEWLRQTIAREIGVDMGMHHHCPGCDAMIPDASTDHAWGACAACEARYPHSLLKAACDPFSYALGLRTGEIIFFESASINGEWVSLTIVNDYMHGANPPYRVPPFPFERGIDVRVADIVWCCDAPYGS